MNWQQIQVALKSFFEQGAGIPFLWANESQRMLKKPMGILSLENSAVLGRDMSGYTFKDSGVTIDIAGQREITVNAQVFSRASHPDQSGRAYLEKARFALKHPIYQKVLADSGLVFVEAHTINDLDHIASGRKESRASLDLVFRVQVELSQPISNMHPIEKVELQEAIA